MKASGWKFVGEQGDFTIDSPHHTSYLYFPLMNEAGMISSITPILHGDVKIGHHQFLTPPVTAEDLHQSKGSRNFWLYIHGKGAWSAGGNSAAQHCKQFDEDEQVRVEAGFLWHKVIRANENIGIKAEIVNFVPVNADTIELMKVKITNIGDEPLQITPTAAIPIFGRSADAVRDHRHVTSLFHQIYTTTHGIEVMPTLSFDERGHKVNTMCYSVLGSEEDGRAPVGFFPIVETFVGEGGSLDWPESIVRNLPPEVKAGAKLEGYEAIGALRFRDIQLASNASVSYTIALVISEGRVNVPNVVQTYLSTHKFQQTWDENKQYWQTTLNQVQFHSHDKKHDLWMKWVTLQPILRRLSGNSFMPHHDYGRGGRGWRDLWQDCLALIFTEPSTVREQLINHFAGVRFDGSNATIIGTKPGEFIADRNNIPRVWMDHGAWPFLTMMLYVNQSGDFDILWEEQTYFKDLFERRCTARDDEWHEDQGNQLKTKDGSIYRGTILEHLIIQNLVPFYNVGEHNNIKLEGADWNDGLDMANDRGESVAFTSFYASNLRELSELLLDLRDRYRRDTVQLAEELLILLDTLSDPIDYQSVSQKHACLDQYYRAIQGTISGNKVDISIEKLAHDLAGKADWLTNHLRKNEWIQNAEGYQWYNGYYNNDGERVEGDHPNGVRMTLTGQVFSIMGSIATEEQVRHMIRSVNRYLKCERIGYRLNTNFGEIQQHLGRAFGFAFGHKENGAMFSHMAVMYANALYKRGFAREGYEVLNSVYQQCVHFERSRVYPGIVEYINENGRGMYHYLTGSASWLLLTQLTEVYGVKGHKGDLCLEPKLLEHQFDEHHQASVVTKFADRCLHIIYTNVNRKDYGEYQVARLRINGESVPFELEHGRLCIQRQTLAALSAAQTHNIEVDLE